MQYTFSSPMFQTIISSSTDGCKIGWERVRVANELMPQRIPWHPHHYYRCMQQINSNEQQCLCWMQLQHGLIINKWNEITDKRMEHILLPSQSSPVLHCLHCFHHLRWRRKQEWVCNEQSTMVTVIIINVTYLLAPYHLTLLLLLLPSCFK